MPSIARTSAEAERIATLLTRPHRDEPIIVIATYALPPEINPQQLEDRTDAEVHVLEGREAMQSFTGALPPGTGVFVKPGLTRLRVYPADLDWTRDQALSRHLEAEEGRRFANRTLPRVLGLVDLARALHAEDYDRGTDLGATFAAAIDEEMHAKILAAIASNPADPQPEALDLEVRSAATEEGPALQGTSQYVEELAALQSDLEAARCTAAALEVDLRGAHEAIRQANAEKDDCRCQQIGEAGSAAAAIRAAEKHTRTADLKVEDAERRATKDRDKANKLREARPTLKWIEQLEITEEDLLRLLVQRTWDQEYGDDDKATFPLRDFEFQTPFVKTINQLHDADRKKILTVATDVATGRADRRYGTAHPWRTGEGAEESKAEDPELGTLMRIYLENNTSAAQRLHYWKKGDEPIRFHSVMRHDDKVTWPTQK